MSEVSSQEKIDPTLVALGEAHEAEETQMQELKHARVAKWPKGKSPEGRTRNFVEKHRGKISRRPPRHSGKGYEGRDPNYKYWVPTREKVKDKADQEKIEDALVEISSKGDADLTVAKRENPPPDWQALREMNEEINAGQEQKYEAQGKTGGERQAPLPWDSAELEEEQRRAKKEKYFGRDRLK